MYLLKLLAKEWQEKSIFEKIVDVVGAIWFVAYFIVLPALISIGLAQLLW